MSEPRLTPLPGSGYPDCAAALAPSTIPASTVPSHTRSPAQDAASRTNALHSTGPRTRLGKLRIRHNGVRHGLYAVTAPMIGERRKEYARLHDTLVAELKPGSELESLLVHRAASLLWRLGRVPAAENALFESFALEAARALRPEDEDEAGRGAPESDAVGEEIGVDLLWGLAFRAGLSDSPVNRITRWERSLQMQLRELLAELARRQAQRAADEAAAARAAAEAAREAARAAAAAEEEAEFDRTHTLFDDIDDDEAYSILDATIAFRDNALTRRELEDEVIRLRAALCRAAGIPPSPLPLHAAGDTPHRELDELRRFAGHPPGHFVNGRWQPDPDDVERVARLVRETLGPDHGAAPPQWPSA
jgi:hypothetical protein